METDQHIAWRCAGDDWSDVGGALAGFCSTADDDEEEDVVLTASEVLEQQTSEIQCAPPPSFSAFAAWLVG
jgi:hypothetical protein